MSGILTTAAATYAAQTLRGTTKTDVVARAAAEVADWCTGDWANDVDDDLIDVNKWFVGTSSAGIAGNETTLLSNFCIGDGSGSTTLALDKTDAGTTDLEFRNGGVVRWRIREDASENMVFDLHNSGGTKIDTPFSINSGTAAATFSTSITAGTNISLSSASPTLTVGNASGSPEYRLAKGAAGNGFIHLATATTGDTTGDKRLLHGTDEVFTIQNYNGATWDSVMQVGSNTWGVFGSTSAQSSAYTRNAAVVEDRTLLASASATTTNNNNVLAALIADLQAYGILG